MNGPRLGFLVLGLLASGCTLLRTKKSKSEPRLVPCYRAAGKITIDGKLDEPAWKRAYRLDDFRVPVTGAKPRFATLARLLWDDENLYLAVVMEDYDVYGVKEKHDSYTWEDDVCELFLKPSEVRHPYYEIHITPRGTTLDLLFGRRGAGTLDRWTPWESGVRAKAVVRGTLNDWQDKDQGWAVEAAIPLKAFARTTPMPQLGERWRFAVCRYDYSVYIDGGKELTSSARLTGASFHRYEDYDFLEFIE